MRSSRATSSTISVANGAPGQDLGRVADPGERIPDLVGDAGGERPDRGEPVAAPPLLVARLLPAQVDEERERPAELPPVGLERQQAERDREGVLVLGRDLHLARLLGRGARAGKDVPLAPRRAKVEGRRLVEHLILRVAEEAARRVVHRLDPSLAVDREDAEGGVAVEALDHGTGRPEAGCLRRGEVGRGTRSHEPASAMSGVIPEPISAGEC
jgi:hypothetical protein